MKATNVYYLTVSEESGIWAPEDTLLSPNSAQAMAGKIGSINLPVLSSLKCSGALLLGFSSLSE